MKAYEIHAPVEGYTTEEILEAIGDRLTPVLLHTEIVGCLGPCFGLSLPYEHIIGAVEFAPGNEHIESLLDDDRVRLVWSGRVTNEGLRIDSVMVQVTPCPVQ